jgi:ABC-type sugar transport system substrate-binding protein
MPKLNFPDFSEKKVIDRHLDRLDTTGVSRRDFLAFASASAAAATAAATLGLPSVAVADPTGKLAYLTGFLRNEWNVQVVVGAKQAAKDLGLNFMVFDSHLDAQEQSNQFDQQSVSGSQGVIFNLSDGGSIRRFAQEAQQNQIWITNIWDSQPWFTPYDANDYWTLYAQPEEFSGLRGATEDMLKVITEKFGGGKVAGVTGNDGSTLDIERSGGRDAAFPFYPKTQLVDQLPGLWNREDSLKVASELLSRHPDLKGFVATDGTAAGARSIKRGEQLATCANPGTFAGGVFTARIYDVTHGWRPKDTERLLNWRSVKIDSSNVDPYLARYIDNGDTPTFDYRKMSKVLYPNDWDPQQEFFPFDVDVLWSTIPKPAGYTYPKAYTDAKTNGEWEAVRQEYAEHYKIKFLDPSPAKSA